MPRCSCRVDAGKAKIFDDTKDIPLFGGPGDGAKLLWAAFADGS
jgi:microcystin degradation protein MlrC